MNIVFFKPKSDIPATLLPKLEALGDITYTPEIKVYPLDELIKLAEGAEIIGITPTEFGEFEKVGDQPTKLAETLPNLKGVALSTTSYGWIDLDYFKSRNIQVTNVPGYSRESVAEHTIGMLLGLAKRFFVTDRRTIRGEYKKELGFDLKGKTLGIIGLGNIGSRVAELAQGIGMNVIAYNPSPRTQTGVTMKPLEEVLSQSDALSLHMRDSKDVHNMVNSETIAKMKDGVIIANTVERDIVDEQAMTDALASGKVYGYAYEAEDLKNTPLASVESAIGLKPFGWYTRETIENMYHIWIKNIVALAGGKGRDLVS